MITTPIYTPNLDIEIIDKISIFWKQGNIPKELNDNKLLRFKRRKIIAISNYDNDYLYLDVSEEYYRRKNKHIEVSLEELILYIRRTWPREFQKYGQDLNFYVNNDRLLSQDILIKLGLL